MVKITLQQTEKTDFGSRDLMAVIYFRKRDTMNERFNYINLQHEKK